MATVGTLYLKLKQVNYQGGLSVHGGSQDIPTDALCLRRRNVR